MKKAPVGLHKCRFIFAMRSRSTEREVRNAKHGTGSTLLLVFRVFLLDSPALFIDFFIGEILIVGAFIVVEW